MSPPSNLIPPVIAKLLGVAPWLRHSPQSRNRHFGFPTREPVSCFDHCAPWASERTLLCQRNAIQRAAKRASRGFNGDLTHMPVWRWMRVEDLADRPLLGENVRPSVVDQDVVTLLEANVPTLFDVPLDVEFSEK